MGASSRLPTGQVRLPPLPHLKVRTATQSSIGACNITMTGLLNCWASNGNGNVVCENFEKELKKCMEVVGASKAGKKKSTINYHAGRLYPRFVGKKD
ncbi:hypothetical protein NADFUDRAFT_53411 [Nadsonia fulvescens var. elongata DSM 6958]|uniref:37S ribosomal protein mrp10, mitochondrial n=1 Tax=Nadsonia fulvescens var. elongata DSM 6958 TaxID=857566 RepID=A0A1E3PFV0_9ASCO|nr:hypothetical protein NADFUDRAFT_53411 [Nadsonia fulvescens var. elongata DSM 6958]